jgi:hypothetical protein
MFVIAVLFWVAAPAVLLTPLSAAFWAAAVALGGEAFRRYRRYLDPRGWLDKKRL